MAGLGITVLGKAPAWQDADGASSGYLVHTDEASLLVDCGSGVFAKLRAVDAHRSVGDIVITHMHADHFLDLYSYAYGMTISPCAVPGIAPRLHLPPGGIDIAERTAAPWGGSGLLAQAFEISEYDPDAGLALPGAEVTFAAVPHYVPAWALAVTVPGDPACRVVFGADCGPSSNLVELAREADLLIAEATLAEADPADPAPGHMSARQAGELAAEAGARLLLLTHFSDELDATRVAAEGEAGYGAPVTLASEGLMVDL